jgi:aerobic carbon-monoxide dehydrogenase large subunit
MSVADQAATERWVGRALKRKEDPRLITGRGNYIEDISLPGTLWAAFVRSPEAHARIVSIDTSAASARDDVVLVATGEDVDGLAGPLPMAWVPPGVEVHTPEHWPLTKGTVKHVGDPVAVVIGTDRYGVVDAADEVAVEYDPLPVVVDPEEALKDETIIHESLGTNVSHRWSSTTAPPAAPSSPAACSPTTAATS